MREEGSVYIRCCAILSVCSNHLNNTNCLCKHSSKCQGRSENLMTELSRRYSDNVPQWSWILGRHRSSTTPIACVFFHQASGVAVGNLAYRVGIVELSLSPTMMPL
uniref:AlNc14C339G10775 protein n=1 Tax=Albugo laibachii Nc14 TaxID=890382 RepID=F0WX19_9STRA|nr:AlNc14C339G10775 [Albugo laibachii Nc14]|eukprot:CCA26007.1 AlNc14C339G10775 [Albugo laibachii Nc14]